MNIKPKGLIAKNVWVVLCSLIQLNGTRGDSRGDYQWGPLHIFHGYDITLWVGRRRLIQFDNPFYSDGRGQ